MRKKKWYRNRGLYNFIFHGFRPRLSIAVIKCFFSQLDDKVNAFPFPSLSPPQFVYVSVRGVQLHNTFSVIIWDMIFHEEMYTVYVPEGVGNYDVFDLDDALRETNVT